MNELFQSVDMRHIIDLYQKHQFLSLTLTSWFYISCFLALILIPF